MPFTLDVLCRFVLLAVPFLLATSVSASVTKATDELKSTIEEVLVIVNDKNLEKDAVARRHQLQETIAKRFDYQQMGVRSLKKVWNQLSQKERGQFTKQFKRLLETAYSNQIENYKEGRIDFIDEMIKGKHALVKTRIHKNSETTELDYKLVRKDDGWKIYDFVINGVSMVRNYHSQFSKFLEKKTFNELLKKMEAI